MGTTYFTKPSNCKCKKKNLLRQYTSKILLTTTTTTTATNPLNLVDIKSTQIMSMPSQPGNIVDISSFLHRNHSRLKKTQAIRAERESQVQPLQFLERKIETQVGKHLSKIPQKTGSRTGPRMCVVLHSP